MAAMLSHGSHPSQPSTRPTGKRTNWDDDPDIALMMRVQEGDDDAFARLQERYAPRIYSYFCRQLRDRGEAEDLTQEVFLRLYRSRLRYQPRASFATWIFHITQNVARNALRSRKRHPSFHFGHDVDRQQNRLEAILCDRGDAPSRPVEQHEIAVVVRAAVAELAGRQRTALELHQFQDRTYAQVAEELEMTPKAAKSLLYRARNQLREVLTGFMTV